MGKIPSEPQVFLLPLYPEHRHNVPGCSGIISSMVLWLEVLLLCRFWQVPPSAFDLWKMSSCCHLGKASCADNSEAIYQESCQLAGCLCCASPSTLPENACFLGLEKDGLSSPHENKAATAIVYWEHQHEVKLLQMDICLWIVLPMKCCDLYHPSVLKGDVHIIDPTVKD